MSNKNKIMGLSLELGQKARESKDGPPHGKLKNLGPLVGVQAKSKFGDHLSCELLS